MLIMIVCYGVMQFPCSALCISLCDKLYKLLQCIKVSSYIKVDVDVVSAMYMNLQFIFFFYPDTQPLCSVQISPYPCQT